MGVRLYEDDGDAALVWSCRDMAILLVGNVCAYGDKDVGEFAKWVFARRAAFDDAEASEVSTRKVVPVGAATRLLLTVELFLVLRD